MMSVNVYVCKQTLNIILKNGRSFLELFLKRSKAVHALFASDRGRAMQALGTLQKATRQMQSICSYGKIRRDKTLSSEAPYLKRALERLIYDMKDMASENRCLGAVWVGTLKHRHIDGSEVRGSEEEEDEEEEEEDSDTTRDDGDGEGEGEGSDMGRDGPRRGAVEGEEVDDLETLLAPSDAGDDDDDDDGASRGGGAPKRPRLSAEPRVAAAASRSPEVPAARRRKRVVSTPSSDESS